MGGLHDDACLGRIEGLEVVASNTLHVALRISQAPAVRRSCPAHKVQSAFALERQG